MFNFITNKQMPVIVDSQADGDRTGRYVLDCRLGLPTKDESDALLQAGFKFVSSEQPMPSRDKQTVLTKAEVFINYF